MKNYLILIILLVLLASCGDENIHDGYPYNQKITCINESGEVIFQDSYVRVVPMGYGGGTWRVSYHDKDDIYEFPMSACEVTKIN